MGRRRRLLLAHRLHCPATSYRPSPPLPDQGVLSRRERAGPGRIAYRASDTCRADNLADRQLAASLQSAQLAVLHRKRLCDVVVGSLPHGQQRGGIGGGADFLHFPVVLRVVPAPGAERSILDGVRPILPDTLPARHRDPQPTGARPVGQRRAVWLLRAIAGSRSGLLQLFRGNSVRPFPGLLCAFRGGSRAVAVAAFAGQARRCEQRPTTLAQAGLAIRNAGGGWAGGSRYSTAI